MSGTHDQEIVQEDASSANDAMEASANGEALAAKIPKLMDISAALPTPKLMEVRSAPTAVSGPSVAPAAVSGATSQNTSSSIPARLPPPPFSPSVTLEQIRSAQFKFVDERDWHKYHTPRNLLLAMVGEVGELSELFQWRGEVGVGLPRWSNEDKRHLRHELADVFLYLVRLSEQCGVDLPEAVLEKIALNEKKYPAEVVRGSNKKYSDFPDGTKLATPRDENATGNGAASNDNNTRAFMDGYTR